VVWVPTDASAQRGQPATREVEVETGLSDGTNTEITSGLTDGEQVVALPTSSSSRTSGPGGFFGGY
jgi:multidrug efflux pump subunit AcrA (membrane-fusion protein)